LSSCRKAEDESKIEGLEVARVELEEKLRLAEAKKMKLEQKVNALLKQNQALARSGQVSQHLLFEVLRCKTEKSRVLGWQSGGS
jgi:hypothetical protein